MGEKLALGTSMAIEKTSLGAKNITIVDSQSDEGTMENLEYRPRHLSMVIETCRRPCTDMQAHSL